MVSMHPYSFCYAFMCILFAYSASVQLNDPDWYFWLPLYSFASVVNMMSVIHLNRSSSYTHMVFIAFWLGLAMLVKVVIEECLFETKSTTIEWKELLSLDMERRVVREKLGSGLVVVSMCFLHNNSQTGSSASRKAGSGMILLVLVSGVLCMVFFSSKENLKP
ncbi:hypothetical protein SUGI_0434290 [Cryptomeria japonica]|uniref:uncharacterized protein LOC131061851 n=1 Tax=Cryptomeria japonica TaxID=3369 RepID=UPI002408A68A|nr:uncharacterized protein LOC131061851 [Cryptomeria japonica]GLJ23014.1 hypothetical protein SUGI_0434290 [Cryptomeria japonica]